jgi:transcription initiation factor TFIID subunit 3
VTLLKKLFVVGCTQPNLDYLGLTFRDMGICVQELEEYVKYVNFGPVPSPVPKYPIPKEDHLNFLKPGSKEVVTRPVHIHEHLLP